MDVLQTVFIRQLISILIASHASVMLILLSVCCCFSFLARLINQHQKKIYNQILIQKRSVLERTNHKSYLFSVISIYVHQLWFVALCLSIIVLWLLVILGRICFRSEDLIAQNSTKLHTKAYLIAITILITFSFVVITVIIVLILPIQLAMTIIGDNSLFLSRNVRKIPQKYHDDEW